MFDGTIHRGSNNNNGKDATIKSSNLKRATEAKTVNYDFLLFFYYLCIYLFVIVHVQS